MPLRVMAVDPYVAVLVYLRLFSLSLSKRYTCQGMSQEDRKQWLEVMEGKEPVYTNIKVLGLC